MNSTISYTREKIIDYRDLERQWRREQEQQWRLDEIQRQIKLLSIPPLYNGHNLSSYEQYDSRQKHVFQQIEEYIQNFSVIAHQPRHSFIAGPCGTGKTMAAYIIARSVIEQGFSARVYRFSDLMDAIKKTWNNPTIDTDDFIKSFSKIDLLIIDEFGRYKISEQDHKDFSKIMDYRYDNKKPNIIISNIFITMKNKTITTIETLLGERLWDRMCQGKAIEFQFNWESYRQR